MSSPKGAKAKGRNLQNLVRDRLRVAFPSLEEDDVKSQTMGMPGEDIVFSPAARRKIPYSFECKNVERLQFWSAVEQAESNLKKGATPAVVVKKNIKKPYVEIPLESFIRLISEGGNEEQANRIKEK